MRDSESFEPTQSLCRSYQEHYQDVQTARTVYHDEVNTAKQQWNSLSEEKQEQILKNRTNPEKFQDQKHCRLKIATHVSNDYAQQVHYPYSSKPTGKEYFMTPRKCQVFGVCAEAISL